MMDATAELFRKLDDLRVEKPGFLRSEKHITRGPDASEPSWCLAYLRLPPLADLPQADHLTELYLNQCTKLPGLKGIAERFPHLRELMIFGCDSLTSLDGLQDLHGLKSLTIYESFSGKITLDSLQPIAGLAQLERLVFAGRSRDNSLRPLHDLPKLQEVFLSNVFPWEEFARFESHHPDMPFRWKGGITYAPAPDLFRCKTCDEPLAMLTGKGLRMACPNCDADRISKHLKRYASLAAA